MHPEVCFKLWYGIFRKACGYKTGPFEHKHRMIQRETRGGVRTVTRDETITFSRSTDGMVSITLG